MVWAFWTHAYKVPLVLSVSWMHDNINDSLNIYKARISGRYKPSKGCLESFYFIVFYIGTLGLVKHREYIEKSVGNY